MLFLEMLHIVHVTNKINSTIVPCTLKYNLFGLAYICMDIVENKNYKWRWSPW